VGCDDERAVEKIRNKNQQYLCGDGGGESVYLASALVKLQLAKCATRK